MEVLAELNELVVEVVVIVEVGKEQAEVEEVAREGEEEEVSVGQAAANACHCPPLEVPAVKVVVLVKVLFVVK